MKVLKDFNYGIKKGMPICLGYIPVAFTFGFLAVSGGIPVWAAVLISLTNLTSAGQFAGLNLMIAGAGYMETGLTVLVINLRYLLMSLSLSQKIDSQIPVWKRMIFSFGITDETFVVASLEKERLTTSYMLGLITMPIVGWNLGTLLGGCISMMLPLALQNAMGIALYAMFIALIIPAARESKPVLMIVVIAVALTCIMKYIPCLQFISSGFRIIISTITAAAIGALLYPDKEEESCG